MNDPCWKAGDQSIVPGRLIPRRLRGVGLRLPTFCLSFLSFKREKERGRGEHEEKQVRLSNVFVKLAQALAQFFLNWTLRKPVK